MREKFTIFVIAVVCAIVLASCHSAFPLMNAIAVPGATGEVKLKTDDNSNTIVSISVKHLAHPEKLSPAKSVYVVWAESTDGKAMNLGQLIVNDDLEGGLTGTTAFHYFRIIITAEDEPTVTMPGSEIVLSTERMKP